MYIVVSVLKVVSLSAVDEVASAAALVVEVGKEADSVMMAVDTKIIVAVVDDGSDAVMVLILSELCTTVCVSVTAPEVVLAELPSTATTE